jgi:uncharacterized membrane protein YesL
MLKRLEKLSVIIGIFFIGLSLILGVGYALTEALHEQLNVYAAAFFFVFGAFMLWVKSGEE